MAKEAKVKVNFDSTAATITIKKTLGKVVQSKALRKEIGEDVVKTIKAKARLQKPLNDTGSFPKLKRMTKTIREYLSRFNNPGKNFMPEKSNVTLTGQFLESLQYYSSDVVSLISGGIVIKFTGDRRPYNTGPKSKASAKNTPSNEDLAGYLAEKGFIVFTKKGIEGDEKLAKRTNSKIKKYLRRALTVLNKTKDT